MAIAFSTCAAAFRQIARAMYNLIFQTMNFATETITELKRLTEEIKRETRIISLSGLTSIASKSFVLSELKRETDKILVIVTDSNKDSETWECDLNFWQNQKVQSSKFKVQSESEESKIQNPKSKIETLPASDSDIYSGVSPHAETLEKRALALWNLTGGKPDFLILSAKSLITKTLAPKEIKNLGATLKRDEDFAPENLIEKLIACGYVREEPLKNIGEFSVRGGIVDVWSPSAEMPVRIEFFGDTVDSIREFDAETQLSTEQLKEIQVAPMREFSATAKDFKDWAFFAREKFADEKFARALKDRTQFAKEGEDFSGWEFLFPLVNPRESSVFDFLENYVLIVDEPSIIEPTLSTFYEKLDNHFAEITEAGEIGLEPRELFLSGEEVRGKFEAKQRVELRALGRTAAQTDEEFQISDSEPRIENYLSEPSAFASGLNTPLRKPLFLFSTAEKSVEFEIGSRSTRKYHGNVKDFAIELKQKNFPAKAQSSPSETKDQKLKTKDQTLVVMQSHGLAERLSEILRDYDVSIPETSLLIGDLSGGFEIPALRLIVHTENDIFGETNQVQSPKSKVQSPKTKSKTSAFISDFRDLKAGDFVVHVDHGIGRFEGLQTIETGGATREFMLLFYTDNAKLFVPVERLDLVSRFSSGEAAQPTLDRLGGLGWLKTKAKAKRSMRDMADELLRLYAERKLVEGFAFSADSPWQIEFEDAFPYQLTIDQATAIDDMKEDMQTAVPMDRLIVGDVGYGKTEVAMRGAFKAVMDNKQVAILTPTTVLAYQHFETFKQRFAAFPVKIELLSRFRSPKEQKQVVKSSEEGKVDILIGTHRILSNDVRLPKLGLVVVDEEQRFGVAHKEKLKQLKKKVDVMTLSATPIPRTLNMSLLGMRDMSVIETPPRDRLAINTQVVQFSEGVIK